MLRFTLASLIAFLLLPTSAGAALRTPHSGWLWGTPEPQGNGLHAIEFADTKGYAIGDIGTLLATDDGGSSWNTVPTGETMGFTHLDVLDGDSLVVGSPCALRRTDDGGATFRRLPFTSNERRCSRRVRAISFPSDNVGYLLFEDSAVLKTTDDGSSFTSLTGLPAEPATDIEFTTEQNGLLTTFTGDIYRTVDGGSSWTREYEGAPQLNGLHFDGARLYAVGAEGTFLISDNGGDTWSDPGGPSPGPGRDFIRVRCHGGACLIVTGGDLVRTQDAGATFQTVAGVNPRDADFASPTRAVAVGGDGRTWVSDDGGNTFGLIGSRLPSGFIPMMRIRATSATLAHATLQRAIARTTDGGETWSAIGVPASDAIVDVAFPTASLGYALDSSGGLYRTTNGGTAWSVLEVEPAQPPQAMSAPDSRVVLLIGPRGMLRSTNRGETFSRVRDRDVRIRTLTNVERAGGSALLAYGPRVIAVSGDKGRTWRRIVRPTQTAEVRSASFVSTRRGYALETDGRMYTTRDRGRNWTELPATAEPLLHQVAFSGARNGWAAVGTHPAQVLRTTDAGRSWRPQVIATSGPLSIATPSARVGFAGVAGPFDPRLFFTRNGGDAGATTRLTISTRNRVLPRARTITINGRLTPASGGEQVEVRYRSLRGVRWRSRSATVARNGSFSVRVRVAGGTVFVGRWPGDADSAGDGSGAMSVRIDRSRG